MSFSGHHAAERAAAQRVSRAPSSHVLRQLGRVAAAAYSSYETGSLNRRWREKADAARVECLDIRYVAGWGLKEQYHCWLYVRRQPSCQSPFPAFSLYLCSSSESARLRWSRLH